MKRHELTEGRTPFSMHSVLFLPQSSKPNEHCTHFGLTTTIRPKAAGTVIRHTFVRGAPR